MQCCHVYGRHQTPVLAIRSCKTYAEIFQIPLRKSRSNSVQFVWATDSLNKTSPVNDLICATHPGQTRTWAWAPSIRTKTWTRIRVIGNSATATNTRQQFKFPQYM